MWLPDEWNDRFLMVGGGGYVGNIPGPGTAVDRGFAVTSTDTGHKADGVTAKWALDNMERQVNYAYLAVHRTAETAKYLVHQDGLLRVPVLVIGDVLVRGYTDALYREALDR